MLVAGGFHTEPITELLRERNVSYIVITPTVDQLTDADHELYVKRLSGQLLTPQEILTAALEEKNNSTFGSRWVKFWRANQSHSLALGFDRLRWVHGLVFALLVAITPQALASRLETIYHNQGNQSAIEILHEAEKLTETLQTSGAQESPSNTQGRLVVTLSKAKPVQSQWKEFVGKKPSQAVLRKLQNRTLEYIRREAEPELGDFDVYFHRSDGGLDFEGRPLFSPMWTATHTSDTNPRPSSSVGINLNYWFDAKRFPHRWDDGNMEIMLGHEMHHVWLGVHEPNLNTDIVARIQEKAGELDQATQDAISLAIYALTETDCTNSGLARFRLRYGREPSLFAMEESRNEINMHRTQFDTALASMPEAVRTTFQRMFPNQPTLGDPLRLSSRVLGSSASKGPGDQAANQPSLMVFDQNPEKVSVTTEQNNAPAGTGQRISLLSGEEKKLVAEELRDALDAFLASPDAHPTSQKPRLAIEKLLGLFRRSSQSPSSLPSSADLGQIQIERVNANSPNERPMALSQALNLLYESLIKKADKTTMEKFMSPEERRSLLLAVRNALSSAITNTISEGPSTVKEPGPPSGGEGPAKLGKGVILPIKAAFLRVFGRYPWVQRHYDNFIGPALEELLFTLLPLAVFHGALALPAIAIARAIFVALHLNGSQAPPRKTPYTSYEKLAIPSFASLIPIAMTYLAGPALALGPMIALITGLATAGHSGSNIVTPSLNALFRTRFQKAVIEPEGMSLGTVPKTNGIKGGAVSLSGGAGREGSGLKSGNPLVQVNGSIQPLFEAGKPHVNTGEPGVHFSAQAVNFLVQAFNLSVNTIKPAFQAFQTRGKKVLQDLLEVGRHDGESLPDKPWEVKPAFRGSDPRLYPIAPLGQTPLPKNALLKLKPKENTGNSRAGKLLAGAAPSGERASDGTGQWPSEPKQTQQLWLSRFLAAIYSSLSMRVPALEKNNPAQNDINTAASIATRPKLASFRKGSPATPAAEMRKRPWNVFASQIWRAFVRNVRSFINKLSLSHSGWNVNRPDRLNPAPPALSRVEGSVELGKGVILPLKTAFMHIFGRYPWVQRHYDNFIGPILEEFLFTLLPLAVAHGALALPVLALARLLFVYLHLNASQAPPEEAPYTLLNELTIPTVISLIPVTATSFIGHPLAFIPLIAVISGIAIIGHSVLNIITPRLNALAGTRFQKAAIKESNKIDRIIKDSISKDPKVRGQAVSAFWTFAAGQAAERITPRQITAFTNLLSDPDPGVRGQAVKVLGWLVGRGIVAFSAAPTAALELLWIEFRDGGSSLHQASTLTLHILRNLTPFRAEALPTPLDVSLPLGQELTLEGVFQQLGAAPAGFERRLGRTLIFSQGTGGEKKWIAVKLQKKGEKLRLLGREANLLARVNRPQADLRLRSRYPVPLQDGQGRPALVSLGISELPNDVAQTIESMERDSSGEKKVFTLSRAGQHYTALVYTAPSEDYFRYLSDANLPEDAYWTALENTLHDLFTLARYGLFHTALIDIFHNIEQRGQEDRVRFLWNVDHHWAYMPRQGAGCLHGFQEAVRYPNLRLSGLADLADVATLAEMQQPGGAWQAPQLEPFGQLVSGTDNFYVESLLGDYLLAAVLLTGPRLIQEDEARKKSGRKRLWKDEKRLSVYAERLRKAFTTAAAAFLNIPEAEANPMVSWSGDFQRLARQMAFYMTGAYVPYFDPDLKDKRSVPEGMYNPDARISFGNYRPGTWDPEGGFIGHRGDPQRALGPVNGPFLIQELIRINYLLTSRLLLERAQPGLSGAAPAAGRPGSPNSMLYTLLNRFAPDWSARHPNWLKGLGMAGAVAEAFLFVVLAPTLGFYGMAALLTGWVLAEMRLLYGAQSLARGQPPSWGEILVIAALKSLFFVPYLFAASSYSPTHNFLGTLAWTPLLHLGFDYDQIFGMPKNSPQKAQSGGSFRQSVPRGTLPTKTAQRSGSFLRIMLATALFTGLFASVLLMLFGPYTPVPVNQPEIEKIERYEQLADALLAPKLMADQLVRYLTPYAPIDAKQALEILRDAEQNRSADRQILAQAVALIKGADKDWLDSTRGIIIGSWPNGPDELAIPDARIIFVNRQALSPGRLILSIAYTGTLNNSYGRGASHLIAIGNASRSLAQAMRLVGAPNQLANYTQWQGDSIARGELSLSADPETKQQELDKVFEPYLAAIKLLREEAHLDEGSIIYQSSERKLRRLRRQGSPSVEEFSGYDMRFESNGQAYSVWVGQVGKNKFMVDDYKGHILIYEFSLPADVAPARPPSAALTLPGTYTAGLKYYAEHPEELARDVNRMVDELGQRELIEKKAKAIRDQALLKFRFPITLDQARDAARVWRAIQLFFAPRHELDELAAAKTTTQQMAFVDNHKNKTDEDYDNRLIAVGSIQIALREAAREGVKAALKHLRMLIDAGASYDLAKEVVKLEFERRETALKEAFNQNDEAGLRVLNEALHFFYNWFYPHKALTQGPHAPSAAALIAGSVWAGTPEMINIAPSWVDLLMDSMVPIFGAIFAWFAVKSTANFFNRKRDKMRDKMWRENHVTDNLSLAVKAAEKAGAIPADPNSINDTYLPDLPARAATRAKLRFFQLAIFGGQA